MPAGAPHVDLFLLGPRALRAGALGTATLALTLAAGRARAAQPTDGQWCGVNDGGRGVGFVVSGGGTKMASGFFSYKHLSGVWATVSVLDVPISDGQFDYTRVDSIGVCIGKDHVWGTFDSAASASGGLQTQSGGGASCPIDYGTASWTAAPVGTTQADVAVSLSGSTQVATPPTRLVLTTLVTNQGALPVDGVQLSSTIPPGLAFVGNSGDCSTAFPCALGTLPACANRTVTSVFDIPNGYAGPDALVHTAAATTTTSEANTSNNSASWTTTVLHPGPSARLWVVDPCRLLDTREGAPLAAGTERTLVAVGHCGVPPTARSLALNVTVTSADQDGDLRLFPAGVAAPLASIINFRAGQTRANSAVISLGTGGALVIHVDQPAGGSVHVIVDVAGYFE